MISGQSRLHGLFLSHKLAQCGNGIKKAYAVDVGFPILVAVRCVCYGSGRVVFSQYTSVLSFDNIPPMYAIP